MSTLNLQVRVHAELVVLTLPADLRDVRIPLVSGTAGYTLTVRWFDVDGTTPLEISDTPAPDAPTPTIKLAIPGEPIPVNEVDMDIVGAGTDGVSAYTFTAEDTEITGQLEARIGLDYGSGHTESVIHTVKFLVVPA